mgnify:CR=1 FL=1
MSDKPKKKVKNKQEVIHNDELGNNYYPSGWKPRRDWNNESNSGEVVHIQPTTDNFKYSQLLSEWGFSPDEFYIVEETIKFSTWDTQLKGGKVEQMFAFKATIKRKKPKHDKYFNELKNSIIKRKAIKINKTKGDNAYFYICADWQFGKAEYGKKWGTDETVEYIRQSIIKAKQNIKDLNKTGTVIDEIYIIGIGDLIESCFGFFDHQPFNVELTKTEQEHIARLMVIEILDGLLPLANKIILGAVVGNHGENRSGKNSIVTTRLDNSDTQIFQIVGEIIEGRERYKHVKVVIPDNFYLTLEVKSKRLTFYHGHMTTGGAGAENKLMNWWKNQAMARLPSGTADILVTGHYHHLRVLTERGRTWIQSPSLDTSAELEARSGLTTSHGVLTFTVSNSGWDNLKIL